eukprot:m.333949 g.333949  ORF g.333949 m.333949 type:complete len:701 (+) comp27745_c4_seq1:2-2104(+)
MGNNQSCSQSNSGGGDSNGQNCDVTSSSPTTWIIVGAVCLALGILAWFVYRGCSKRSERGRVVDERTRLLAVLADTSYDRTAISSDVLSQQGPTEISLAQRLTICGDQNESVNRAMPGLVSPRSLDGDSDAPALSDGGGGESCGTRQASSPIVPFAVSRRGVPVAVFYSHSLESSGGILRSLLDEVERLNEHHDTGVVEAVLGRIGHSCVDFERLVDKLTALQRAIHPVDRPIGTTRGLVLQFIGHGDDGELSFEGGARRANELARAIAACRPSCVIFNACDTSGIAAAVHMACTDEGLDTTVCFWWTNVLTETCEMLSRRLFIDISVQVRTGEWDGSAASFGRVIRDVHKPILGYFIDQFGCLFAAPSLGTFPPLGPHRCSCCNREVPLEPNKGGCGVVDGHVEHGVPTERGGYNGALRPSGLVNTAWTEACWLAHFAVPTVNPVAESEYRCTFSHAFSCKAGPSRAYYFKSWPAGAVGTVDLCLHVHYWTEPTPTEPGRPKHINLRRAFPVDMAELQRRVDGDTNDPMPPPVGMVKDTKPWTTAMAQFVHDPAKDHAAEKARASKALQVFAHVLFCPVDSLWLEKSGVIISGGPMGKNVMHKMSMDPPGWNFAGGEAFPLRPAAAYKPAAFVPPKVPAAAVAPVLLHAETVRTTHTPAFAESEGTGGFQQAWRGSTFVREGAQCRAQAHALADGYDAE